MHENTAAAYAARRASDIADRRAYHAASTLRRLFAQAGLETTWGCRRRGEYFVLAANGLRYTVSVDPANTAPDSTTTEENDHA